MVDFIKIYLSIFLCLFNWILNDARNSPLGKRAHEHACLSRAGSGLWEVGRDVILVIVKLGHIDRDTIMRAHERVPTLYYNRNSAHEQFLYIRKIAIPEDALDNIVQTLSANIQLVTFTWKSIVFIYIHSDILFLLLIFFTVTFLTQ